MDNRIGLRRLAVLGIAGVFAVAAVSGFFQRGGWADNVEAVDLQRTLVDLPANEQLPPSQPGPGTIDDEPANRRGDDDDDGFDAFDDDDDDDPSSTGNSGNAANSADSGDSGDGDRTRGDDGTSGGNNTANSANSGDGNLGNSDSRSRSGTSG